MMINVKKRISVKLNLLLFQEFWIDYKIPKQLGHEIREVKFLNVLTTLYSFVTVGVREMKAHQ